jgi:hypothetical protein
MKQAFGYVFTYWEKTKSPYAHIVSFTVFSGLFSMWKHLKPHLFKEYLG